MASVHAEWKVLPHGPIERLAENLWRVRGEVPHMPIGRVMTLVRRADGGVVVHSAIALEEPLMGEIEAWGRPAFLVVPNRGHRLDAPAFARRYPDARVLCPAGAREKVAGVVRVDGDFRDLPPDPDVALAHLDGLREQEGVVQVRSADGATLVFNDAIFNLPAMAGLVGLIYRLTGSTGRPRVSRLGRLVFVRDRAGFRAHLERLAAVPDLRRIIVSHGDVITDAPAATLRGIAAEL
ncbi:MAG TPA: hypothetical protein VK698_09420 [Kofleriaceae bacterium]|nr:hypothetical protein [Kofleriaceae bacterium]